MSDNIPNEPIFTKSRRFNGIQTGHKPKFSLSKRTAFITTGIVILISLVVFAGLASNNKKGDIVSAFPTPTQMITPTPIEPAPTEEITPTTSPTPSTKKTPTPTTTNSKTSDLDRANLTIAIQNGGGVAGAATKASNTLKNLGYEIVSAGNADNFDYTNTIIQVKSTKKAYLELLKKDLSEDYTIGEATADLTGSSADALVIIGKK